MKNFRKAIVPVVLGMTIANAEEAGEKSDWLKAVTAVDTNRVIYYMEEKSSEEPETEKANITADTAAVISRKSLGELRSDDPLLYHYFLYRTADDAEKIWKSEAKKRAKAEDKRYKELLEEERRYVINNALALEQYNETSPVERKRISTYESTENYFVGNKEMLDQVRGKYVISPHEDNFIIVHSLGDSTIADGKYVGERASLHWQFSFKFPLLVWRANESGAYFDFTNTGCFDFTNGKESYPVSKKSFKPGAFLRFDFETLKGVRESRFDNELDLGVYHHSNGGYDEHNVSRSIMYLVYLRNRFKAFRHKPDPTLYSVYSNHYLLTVDLKAEYYGGIDSSNSGIRELWGPVRAKVQIEKAINLNKNNSFQMLFWNDWSFARSSQWVSLSIMPVNETLKKRKPVRIPLTYYVKFYQGRDEYLLNYRDWDRWIGGGLILRK